MQLLDLAVLVATAATIVAGTVIGGRLMLLARRTRRIPEAALGICLFVYGGICQPVALTNVLMAESLGSLGRPLIYAVMMGAYIPVLAGIAVFAWQVFGRNSAWRRALALCLIGLNLLATGLAVAEAWPLLAAGLASAPPSIERLGNLMFAVAFMWAAIESARCYGQQRRRATLGLSDPVVTNRFLLWGLGSSASSLLVLGLLVLSLSGRGLFTNDPTASLLVAAAGMVSSVCWALAFMPPQSYLGWVKDRATAGG